MELEMLYCTVQIVIILLQFVCEILIKPFSLLMKTEEFAVGKFIQKQ